MSTGPNRQIITSAGDPARALMWPWPRGGAQITSHPWSRRSGVGSREPWRPSDSRFRTPHHMFRKFWRHLKENCCKDLNCAHDVIFFFLHKFRDWSLRSIVFSIMIWSLSLAVRLFPVLWATIFHFQPLQQVLYLPCIFASITSLKTTTISNTSVRKLPLVPPSTDPPLVQEPERKTNLRHRPPNPEHPR